MVALFFQLTALAFALASFTLIYGTALPFSQYLLAPVAFSFTHLEYLALSAFVVALSSGFKWARWTTALLMLTAFSVQTVQTLSLYFSGDLLTPDVLAHAALVGLLVSPFTLAFALLPTVGASLAYWFYARRLHLGNLSPRERWAGFGALAAVFIVAMVANNNIPQVKYVKFTYQAGKVSPMRAFVKTLRAQGTAAEGDRVEALPEESAQAALRFGVEVNPEARYPFVKEWYYKTPLPFAANAKTAKPNVIVLFVESLSARIIDPYTTDFKGITPNIGEFSRDALLVEDYYNHATPTIVGLRGQLCSSLPRLLQADWVNAKFALKSSRARCLPEIMAGRGYETVYLGYSHPNETFFEPQMAELGFKTRYFFKDLLEKFKVKGEPARNRQGNGDAQMMEALTRFLEERKTGEPFFLGLSTIETHPGLDVKDPAHRYSSLGRDNEVLNSTHAFDKAFGEFWRYFKNSPWRENTILVLTADHAHAPGTVFRELVNDAGYTATYFDKIPLIILDPTKTLPKILSARATSLALAPTLLHLTGADQEKNHLLGRSLFDADRAQRGFGVMSSDGVAVIDENGAHERKTSLATCLGKDADPLFCPLYKLALYYREMDRLERIWPE